MKIKAGDRVEARDAYGDWFPATATTGVEPTHVRNPETGRLRRIHDFPVIWVLPDQDGADRSTDSIPWPAEDVRPV